MTRVRLTPKQFLGRMTAAHPGWESGWKEIAAMVRRGETAFACLVTGAHLAIHPTPKGRFWTVQITGYLPDQRDEKRCVAILTAN